MQQYLATHINVKSNDWSPQERAALEENLESLKQLMMLCNADQVERHRVPDLALDIRVMKLFLQR